MNFSRFIYTLSLAVCLWLGSGIPALAQYSSENGLYEVDEIRGCPGLTITITNNNPSCDCTAGCSCDFDYNGDGNFEVKPNFYEYTYTDPGTYRMEILFDAVSDFITITIEDKPAPAFEIYACSGNSIALEVLDDNYDEYEINYGDGSPVVTIPVNSPVQTHTFPDGLARTITVKGLDAGWANNCSPAMRTFTPVPSLPAGQITGLAVTSDQQITLGLGTQADILYRMYIATNGGPYTLLKEFSDTRSTDIIDLLSTDENYYCFRLDAIDPCGGPAASSQEVCSIQLSGFNQNNINQLDWATNTPSGNFSIYRDGVFLSSAMNTERMLEDPDINCGITYCYNLQASYGGALSTSGEICILADNELPPAAVDHVSTVPNGNEVTLTWNYSAPPGSTIFNIYRSGDTQVPALIGTTTDLTFVDTQAGNSGFTTYCYEVFPEDLCGNANTENVVACVMRPQGAISLRDEVQISWPQYEGYSTGVAYYFVEKSYDGTNFFNVLQTSDTTFTETDNQPDQILYYRIHAFPNDGSIPVSYSYTIQLSKSNLLAFPEAFTPDGDGLNDVLEIRARYVQSYSIDVFNRWGELIFHSEDINNPWNGFYNGERVAQGAYVIKIRLVDESGRVTNRDGSILVLSH
ncbi:gliding motility-associated C-terminal domain-containing protein [Fulvivirga sedimenti]|uniref:Gliding motility-associated C-terminal domain-containing protein n=1 Tax=Fulvivirga sedimenti TaxID=2879465 RepID=A0A9X1HUA0_9BACT|nr:gliding motility-associated C-terminal domain-containing protein [Fulvivirga sedimenti]MCA6075382.1 gliding motility-associated C-terminal domain-containing protein [Fulvivirga sedimenti]MCA6076559.1 gliding motility-associated C-terminal domain-containing protein [Fulvivirga sedimenti]MCA6077687.1 gliding motility-associated C-terminal domain-containing protein [Fulvivirga sedimenti]